jgi:hypothetical protein
MVSGREAVILISLEPHHLPRCPIDSERYDRLYAFNGGTDDFLDNDAEWQQIRIRPNLDEVAVYRLLPSARDFEYGGYLTKARIRFRKCDLYSARMPMSKACTFHSHPSDSAMADLPSAADVFQFLNFRHLRAITVGSKRLWVWDKSKATMSVVKKVGAWVEGNMVTEVNRLTKTHPHAWQDPYVKLALNNLGFHWPGKLAVWEANWLKMLRTILKIKVRVFPRDFGVNSR